MANKTIKQITTENTSLARDDWFLVQRDTDNVNTKARFSNISAIANSFVTAGTFPFIATGGAWTADSAGVNRNASMTALTCWIGVYPIAIPLVTARTFTASKDTYIDILSNSNGTGTLVYTEVTNNAASPALAANSLRLGIIVTGVSTIAAASSINQGQETALLPIASSIAYTKTDSLGNLINPRDPTRKVLGYRQVITNQTIATGTYTDLTGLSCPVIIPTGRSATVKADMPACLNGTGGSGVKMNLYDVTGAAQLTETYGVSGAAAALLQLKPEIEVTPTAGARTYKAQFAGYGAATGVQSNNPGVYPVWIKVVLDD